MSSLFTVAGRPRTKWLVALVGFAGGGLAPRVVVYRRDGGLTAADRRTIARDREEFNALRERKGRDADPRIAAAFRQTTPLGEPQPSRDGAAAPAPGPPTP